MNSSTHFLIVDDYENIRTLVRQQLEEFGFEENITEADNVDKAISLLEGGLSPDFIISDWNMPGKTGLDFLKWVRTSSNFKDLPFLILTTESEKDKILDAVSNGVSNFLLKPWDDEDLSEKIEQCWSKHHS